MSTSTPSKKLLTQLVDQYRQKHQKPPQRIVVSPIALTALALERTIAPTWQGIPVECREIQVEDIVKSGPRLGIEVQNGQIVSFDLEK